MASFNTACKMREARHSEQRHGPLIASGQVLALAAKAHRLKLEARARHRQTQSEKVGYWLPGARGEEEFLWE